MNESEKKVSRQERAGVIDDALKLPPLERTVIERMDGVECLRELIKRTGLSENEMFKKDPGDSPNKKWNRGEVAKFALLCLDGNSTQDIADFYTIELGKYNYNRTDEYFVRKETLHVIAHRYFSSELDVRIKTKRVFLRTPEGLAFNPEANRIISEIERETGLPRVRLFSGKLFPEDGNLTALHMLKGFLMRVRGMPYADIFKALSLNPDQIYASNTQKSYTTLFMRIFSTEAKKMLPNNISRRKK